MKQNKMKVAIITERANISLGGAERSIFELTAALRLFGVDVKVLAATGTSHSKRVQVLFAESQKRIGFDVFRDALAEHFKTNKYDIIHSTLPLDFADIYQPRGGSYTEAAIRNAASYKNNSVRIFKMLTSFANFKRTKLLRAERKLCENKNSIIVAALSEYVKKQFQRHYNLPQERIRVIPNGVKIIRSTDKARIDRTRALILSQFNIKEADEPVFFLFAANNFRLKGLLSLIDAMAIVKQRPAKRPAYLIVAGRGAIKKYQRIVEKAGIKDRVIYMGQTGSIKNLLLLSDVAVLPTYYDPASRFILEALSAGKPVITTKFNGAADLFTADRHGKVFDSPDNIGALAEAIRYFCSTENITTAKNAIEQDNIKSRVSIKTHCEKLIKLYEEIIRNRTQR
jgi:UDP-glucose:(heptosyl)LPS alpha-1,3-glucosyltransferase